MSDEELRAENRRLYEQNVQLRKDIDAARTGREAMEVTRDGVRQRDLALIAELVSLMERILRDPAAAALPSEYITRATRLGVPVADL